MAIRDILVHVPSRDRGEATLAQSIGLTGRHQAHLIGLHVVDVPVQPVYGDVPVAVEISAEERETYLQRARETEAWFSSQCTAAGVAGEWRCVEGETASVIATHARYVDLIALAQDEKDAPKQIVHSVILQAGRPVLVVPRAAPSRPIGEYVMVAWDARREAARAVNDAIPLLELAKHVQVLTINPDRIDTTSSIDLAAHLARHGVDAEALVAETNANSVGERLLEKVKENQSDLLVMGAYSHSRLREAVLGGVTRHVLEHGLVPTLFAH